MSIFRLWDTIYQQEADGDAGSPPPASAPTETEATRPDYIQEKFWDSEAASVNVENMAKSYNELNSKFGGFTGAPKEGYQVPEGFEADDDLFKTYSEYASGINMSQAAFAQGWELVSTQAGVSAEVSVENELAKLGDNPQARIDKVDNYLRSNLSADKYIEMAEVAKTAEGIKLVEALIPAQAQPKLSGDIPNESGLTLADVNEMANKKDENGNYMRSVDPSYNKKVMEAYAKVV
jgi:hypothetical protein